MIPRRTGFAEVRIAEISQPARRKAYRGAHLWQWDDAAAAGFVPVVLAFNIATATGGAQAPNCNARKPVSLEHPFKPRPAERKEDRSDIAAITLFVKFSEGSTRTRPNVAEVGVDGSRRRLNIESGLAPDVAITVTATLTITTPLPISV